jgi:hypothetical protein
MYDGLTKYSKVTDGNPMSSGNKRFTLGRWSSYEFGGLADEARLSNIKRSDAWLKASYYSNFNNLLNYGVEQLVTSGTLSYGNRLKITIPPTYVDSNLSDFPVLIKLSTDCGLTGFDASLVFDELVSDANRKKIAVTAEDGVSECFVEIEKWSDSSEEAWLWVKVPSISSSTSTILYLYYDVNAAENTDFVGDVTSYPGQQVWTNNFEAVYHMGESSGGIVDSTSNGWDSGTPGGSPTRDVDAKVGGGIDWTSPGTAGGSMSFTDNQVTVETWVKPDSVPGSTQRWYTVTSEIAVLRHEGSGTVKFFNRLSGIVKAVTASSQVDTDWGYFAGTWNGTTQKVYKSGAEVGSTGQTGTLDDAVSFTFNSGGETFYGLQDETRVSIVARTESWLKATYYTCEDGFLYMQDDPTQPEWLGTWDQRIKITIDNTKVDEDLLDFPVLVKVSDSSGITSADLIAFFNELTLSSGVYNKSDYYDDFTGTNGDPPDIDKWTETDPTNLMDIQSNKLHFDGEGSGNPRPYITSTFKFDGNYAFDIQIDFDLLTWISPSTNDNYVRFYIYADGGSPYTYMARQQGTGGATNRMRLYGGSGTNDFAWNYTGTTGKFRFTWNGSSTLKAYVWTGSQWEWNGNTAGYTCSENYAGEEITIQFLFEQETNGGDVEATFDNFQINSGYVIYDVNRKKVAFTTADGTTQCYAEIEEFDVVDEEVFYWVKVPVISSTDDTILYLYYDSSQADNSSFIGDTTETAARNVWDSNFVMVQHMAQNPTGTMTDSTPNATDTTATANFEAADLVDGLSGKAISGDGVNENFDLPTTGILEVSPFTLEVILQKDTQATTGRIMCYLPKDAHATGRGWSLGATSGGIVSTVKGSGDGSWEGLASITAIDNGQYHHLAVRFEADTLYDLVVNGTIEDSETAPNLADVVYTNGGGTSPPWKDSRIFSQVSSGGGDNEFMDGKIDEIRISNIVRSLSWVRATNYTARDNLISFGAPETEPAPSVGTFNGYVELAGNSVARIVALYRRSTGELQDYTTSNPNTGYFELETPYDELHYLVILPNISDGYQPITRDQIDPV